MDFNHEFNCYVTEDGLHKLTVCAWEVAEFYDKNGSKMDHLFHFDGVSVAESDSDLYVNPNNVREIKSHLHKLPEGMRPTVECWCNAVDRPMASEMRSIIERMGYKLVHTWYESHGEGNHTFHQDRIGSRAIVVCSNRTGRLTTFYKDNRRYDYLLAAEIEKDLKEAEEDPEAYISYRLLSQESFSACHTASWFDVLERGARKAYRVHRVAGHGSYASELSILDMPKCEDCGEHIPFKDIALYQKESNISGMPRVCEDCAEAQSVDNRMVRHAEG